MSFQNNLVKIFIRPLIYLEVPGWSILYNIFVGDYRSDNKWKGEPPATVVGKLHSYKMELNLDRWSERATYFLGRYYELETQLLLQNLLKIGDRFVDIGANIGMTALVGSRIVGDTGIVEAFEPNPHCADRIRSFIKANGIKNIEVNQLGLSDSNGIMELNVPKFNSGEGTLTSFPVNQIDPSNVEHFSVKVCLGDEFLKSNSHPIKVIKIDVEGFECRVLNGLKETLANHHPVLLMEAIDEHLKRAGNNIKDLFGLLDQLGYEVFKFFTQRGFFGKKLFLRPALPGDSQIRDIVCFPKNQNPFKAFIEKYS